MVNHALSKLTDEVGGILSKSVKALVHWMQTSGITPVFHVNVSEPELSLYDLLLENRREAAS